MSNTKARNDGRELSEPRIIEAPDSERQILIAVLEHRTIPAVAEEVLPEDFSHPREQRTFRAMRELDRSGKLTFDALKERLKKSEAEGTKPEEGMEGYLSALAGEVALGPAALAGCVVQIKNAAREREIRDHLHGALKRLEAGELDADALVRESKAKLERWEATPSSDAKPVSARLEQIYESILTDKTKPVPTFSAALNKNLSGGLRRGEVLTITAPAGAGKTTFILQLAEETVRERVKRAGADSTIPPCALVYVSAEMSEKELVTKSLSRLGRLDSCRIRDKSIGEEALKPAMKQYAEEVAPVMYLVQARDGMTLDEVRGIARKVKTRLSDAVRGTTEDPAAEDPFVILCVDPFQRLLTGIPAVDNEEISRVGALGSGLKKLARDLDVSVILAADTTKDVARRSEGGGGVGVAAIRGSYMATHTTDYEAAIVTWGAKDPSEDELNDKLKKKFLPLMEDYSLDDFDELSLPSYAVLSFSKNRFGLCEPCPFVWERAYNRFVPIGKAQAEDSGGTKGSLLERWGVQKQGAGDKASSGRGKTYRRKR